MNPLRPERSVVVLVDLQTRLAAAMPQEARDDALRHAAILAEAAHAMAVPIFVTEQYPKGLGPTVPELNAILSSPPSDLGSGAQTRAAVFEKLEFDAYANGTFREALHAMGRTQVVLAGMEAHICVYQTARGLAAAGYEVHVATDATCSRRADHWSIARDLWASAGALPSTTETILFDWLQQAGDDRFKRVSKLLR